MGEIARAAVVTALGMSVGRIAGLAREIVVAALFGVSGQMDTWVVAFTLIGVPSAIVMNALQTALIPALSRTRNPNERRALLSAAVTVTLVVMGIALVVLLGAGKELLGLIHSGTDATAVDQSWRLLWLLLPYYFCAALNLIGYGALQAQRQFAQNAIIPMFAPLTVIGSLLLSPGDPPVEALALAVSAGAVAECLILILALRRSGLDLVTLGSPMPMLGDVGVARQAMWLVPGTVVMSLMPVIEQAIASALGEGANSALAYGQRVPTALNGILVSAVGIAVLPFFSTAIARDGPEALSRLLSRQAWRVGIAALLVASVLSVASPWIVRFLYERGAFDLQASGLVATAQAAYFMQTPGMIVGMLYTRAAVAQGRAKMVTVLSIFTVAMQAALAWSLSLRLGLTGLGLAAALASAGNAALLIMLLGHASRAPRS